MPLPGSSPADVPFRPARWGAAFPSAPGPARASGPTTRTARPPHGVGAAPRPAGGSRSAAVPPGGHTGPVGRAEPGWPAAGAGPAAERLWRLAEDIDASLAGGPPGDGALLMLRAPGVDAPDGAEVDLGWLPLDGRHPLDVLMGLRAPDGWQAVGVSCSGGVVPGEAERHRGRSHASSPAVHVTTLLDRAGRSASVLRTGGRARRLPEAPEGAVGDGLRRALGLPTAPPPATTAPYWVAWWLDRIVDRALAGRPPTTWAEVATLHPACPFSLPGRGPRPVTLARAAADLAHLWPWHRLRTDAAAADLRARAAGEGPGPCIPGLPTPADAAWMDDGMFARWLFGALPMPADLLDACRSVLPAALYDEVGDVVESTSRLHASAPPPPPDRPLPGDHGADDGAGPDAGGRSGRARR